VRHHLAGAAIPALEAKVLRLLQRGKITIDDVAGA
jgi:hypothetical protein